MNDFIQKLDNLFLFFAIYTLIFLTFFGTLNYTLPFVLALMCGFILKKPTLLLIKKFKLKSSIASLITTIIFFAIIISLLTWGVTALTQETIQLGKNTQSYVASNFPDINSFVSKIQQYYKGLDPSISSSIENNLSQIVSKASSLTVDITGRVLKLFINFLSSIPYIIMVVLFTLLTTYFFTRDMTSSENTVFNLIPQGKTDKISYILSETKRMLGNYVLSYLLIISVTFIETLIIFFIFKVKYTVILSIVCAIFDLLPILGIGSIYIPIAVIYFLLKNYVVAFGLIISYAIVSIIRQLIEPKIVSSTLGIHPVAVLAALFIGLKANGVSGMFFCIFLVVFYNIFRRVNVL
jgi:sporulation integral membrane protein YtvI